MPKKTIEITVGLFMLAGLLALIMLALKVSGLSTGFNSGGYTVTAYFDNLGGLKVRAPVTIAGVRVGEVSDINLNRTTFKANVAIKLDSQQNTIPVDTSASILTQGLLGANYIELVPGFSEKPLKEGDQIENTHPAIILENLIGQLMFKLGSSK